MHKTKCFQNGISFISITRKDQTHSPPRKISISRFPERGKKFAYILPLEKPSSLSLLAIVRTDDIHIHVILCMCTYMYNFIQILQKIKLKVTSKYICNMLCSTIIGNPKPEKNVKGSYLKNVAIAFFLKLPSYLDFSLTGSAIGPDWSR